MDGEGEGAGRYIAYFRNIKAVIRPSLRTLKKIPKNRRYSFHKQGGLILVRVLVHSAEVGDAFRPVSLPPSIYYVANGLKLLLISLIESSNISMLCRL